MSVGIQLAVVIGMPLFLIYSTILFCYGHRQGYDAGFDNGMRIKNLA